MLVFSEALKANKKLNFLESLPCRKTKRKQSIENGMKMIYQELDIINFIRFEL